MSNILFVDDEPSVLHAIKRSISDESFTGYFSSSAEEALNMLATHDFSILVTDMKMPEKDGLWLLKEAKALCPDTLRIVLSGYTDLSQVLSTINQGDIFRFITKPWDTEKDLLPVLRQGLEYDQLRRAKAQEEAATRHRNIVYQKVLHRITRTESSTCPKDLGAYKQITDDLFQHLLQQAKTSCDLTAQKKLTLFHHIMTDYGASFPIKQNLFKLEDIAAYFQQCFASHAEQKEYRLQIKSVPVTCRGNWPLLQALILAIARLIGHSSSHHILNGQLSVQLYPLQQTACISHVLEFGYVDGAKVTIDPTEWINYSMMDFYAKILNTMGTPHQMYVTYTYIHQNASILTLEAHVDWLTQNGE